MVKILIPRSDSISAKIIEPSDFESFFSSDIINDYVKSGFTLSAGTGLSVNIAVGLARLKGLFINNSTASSKGSLTASQTNYIYVTLARDINGEAESWSFTSNTTGTTPTDSLFIGTATTDGSSVTAINHSSVMTKVLPTDRFGNGSDGSFTATDGQTLTGSGTRQYTDFTIGAGDTLNFGSAGSPLKWIIFATGTITINGTANLQGKGSPVGVAGYNGVSVVGGTGGNGGDSGSGSSSGGVGGTGASGTGGVVSIGNTDSDDFIVFHTAISKLAMYGAGGGAGGAGASGGAAFAGSVAGGGAGGSGGLGGGSIVFIAPTIVLGANASINCDKTNGTAGSAGANGGSSGGNPAVGGGAGGAGGAAGGGNGSNGSTGQSGGFFSGGGGGGGGGGTDGKQGGVVLMGYNIPSQSDLNSKSIANKKFVLEW